MNFRCIQDHDCSELGHAKYMWPAGLPRRIFNPSALDVPGTRIAVSEGEFDTMIANQVAMPTAGIPGVKNWKPFMARCFKGYDEVLILADGDLPKPRPNCKKCKDRGLSACAGHRAGLELAEAIERDVPQARTVMMPDGHDVNSFVLEHGEDALRSRLGI